MNGIFNAIPVFGPIVGGIGDFISDIFSGGSSQPPMDPAVFDANLVAVANSIYQAGTFKNYSELQQKQFLSLWESRGVPKNTLQGLSAQSEHESIKSLYPSSLLPSFSGGNNSILYILCAVALGLLGFKMLKK